MERRASLTTVLCLLLGAASAARAGTRVFQTAQKGAGMASHGSGTFEVKVKPLPNDEKVAGLTVGRMALDKEFKGDLEGTSKGEMMTADPGVQGSGGYVAIEHVSGTLRGRRGTFTLLHQGTMKGADFKLSIVVVPDSGTGQLAGLAGTMEIVIKDGKHLYEIDYTLPDAP